MTGMTEEEKEDKAEFDNAIKYFQNIIHNNISKYAAHKMATTFIGIKTNISGILKLHIYILFFPFPKTEIVVPYCNHFPNIYLKDLCFDVDESFYLWIYEEMKKQNSIVIMSLDTKILKVVSRNGDALHRPKRKMRQNLVITYKSYNYVSNN